MKQKQLEIIANAINELGMEEIKFILNNYYLKQINKLQNSDEKNK